MYLFLQNFTRPVLLLLFLLLVGSFGYHLIEGWNFLDSLYMTLITLSTVGFGEVHHLTDDGKLFTIFLMGGGVIYYAYILNTLAKSFMETRFTDLMRQAKLNRKIVRMKNHYIICGGGRMAFTIGQELERAGESFVFIERNFESVVSEHRERWPILHKDALLEDTLLEARIQHARGLASVLPTDADNLFVVLSARRLNPDLFIQTRIAMETTRSKMLQAGADKVVSPYNVGGLQIARSFTTPHVDDFLSVVTDRAHYDFELLIHRVTEEDSFRNKPIRESSFRERGFIVIGVRFEDNRMKFAPDANFILKEGVEIFLLGPGKDEEEIVPASSSS